MRLDAGFTVVTIVVWGPPQAGKASVLRSIASMFNSQIHSEDRHSERVLRLDLTSNDFPRIGGAPVRVRLIAIPGAAYYSGGRRSQLTDMDGLLFVADSRKEAIDENIAALNELFSDLLHNQQNDVPGVMLFNKQDLAGVFPASQLQPLLNARSWPSHPGSAMTGSGLRESITDLLQRLAAKPVAPAPAAASPARSVPQRILLTCWRCQSMLDVENASIGSQFTCASCRNTMEVIDTDRGLTRAPARNPASGGAPVIGSEPTSGGYAMPEAGSGSNGALSPASSAKSMTPLRQPAAQRAAAARSETANEPSGALPILPQSVQQLGGVVLPEGFVVLAALDVSPLGRRMRICETVTGTTYRALVIADGAIHDPGFGAQLQTHVRKASTIRHLHLAGFQSMKPIGSTVVFIAEDGTDREPLAHVLARRRVLAPPHAVSVAIQILEALDVAAAQGITHGWIRPDVVWLSADGVAQLDELYVPKPLRLLRIELSGSTAATEYYLAPEYMHEDAVADVRSDIFLVGALLFRMLTGQGLVTGYTANEALHQYSNNGPIPLRNIVSTLSRDLEQIIKRMVAIDRRERPQSIQAALESLRRFGGGAHRQTLSLTRPVSKDTEHPGSLTRQTTKSRSTTVGGGSRLATPHPVPANQQRSATGLGAPAPAPVGAVRPASPTPQPPARTKRQAPIVQSQYLDTPKPTSRRELGWLMVGTFLLIVAALALSAFLLDIPRPWTQLWSEYMHPVTAPTDKPQTPAPSPQPAPSTTPVPPVITPSSTSEAAPGPAATTPLAPPSVSAPVGE